MAIKRRKVLPDPTTVQTEIIQSARPAGRNPFLQGLRLDVFNFVAANPGCTRQDVSNGLKLRTNSCTARIKELIDEGILWEPTGVVKKNSSGVKARTLAVAPEGAGIPVRDRVRVEITISVDAAGVYFANAQVLGARPVIASGPIIEVYSKEETIVVPRVALPTDNPVSVMSRTDALGSKELTIDGEYTTVK